MLNTLSTEMGSGLSAVPVKGNINGRGGMPITEKAFQATIVQAARYAGWRVYWVWNSMHSPKGWPDVVCLKDGRILIYEVKTEQGRIRPEQLECLALLQAAGIPARIVRPSDFDSVFAELQDAGNGEEV
jgi:hypothetical protein